jgi:hypothetical protein
MEPGAAFGRNEILTGVNRGNRDYQRSLVLFPVRAVPELLLNLPIRCLLERRELFPTDGLAIPRIKPSSHILRILCSIRGI